MLNWAARVAKAFRWYLTSLMGDGAYEVYVAHQQSTHPDAAPLREREFWIERYHDQEITPGSRCC